MAAGARLAEVVDLDAFCARLDSCWNNIMASAPKRALLRGGPARLDTAWMTNLLVREVPMEAVVFDHSQWKAVSSDWPLLVGLPPSKAGVAMLPALRNGWYRELFEPVIVRSGEPVDLLLFPGTLSQALRSARKTPQRRACAVIVLGSSKHPVTVENLRELSWHWGTAAVVVCELDPSQGPAMLFDTVAELSHNLPLPLAVFNAYRHRLPSTDTRLPVVLGDLDFADRNRPLDVAHRMANALRRRADLDNIPLPPELAPAFGSVHPTTIADVLEFDTPHWHWEAETQGATRLVNARRSIEATLGQLSLREFPLLSEPMESAGPPEAIAAAGAPEPSDSAAEAALPRHVKFNLLPAEPSAPVPPTPVLQPNSAYWLQVFIAGLEVQAHATAPISLDESSLDDREEGHELTIVYCPLSPVERCSGEPAVPPPVSASLHLPQRGATERVEFALSCGQSLQAFRARLIVLHANRALQTLLLTAGADGLLRLDTENFYAPGFESPSAEVPSDLTFVINESPKGGHGLATIGKDAVSFIEPAGLDSSLEFMLGALKDAMEEQEKKKGSGMDQETTLSLMRTLANHGALIHQQLARQHTVSALEAARRIQVVEAVDKAFFPAELIYSGKPPVPAAQLCPHALKAIEATDNEVHEACEHRNDKHHVCPMAFWGFNKCVERHTATASREHVLSVPVVGEERLGPFKSVLAAASHIAKKEMGEKKGLPATLQKMVPRSVCVKSWDAWSQEVRTAKPDLLILLAHSDKSKDFGGFEALEISTDFLSMSNLDEEYVHMDGGKGPLVLLLGCSTSQADIPFLSSVRQFHAAGAPAVIGTLSIVTGPQAHLIVREWLELAMDTTRVGQRLDEAMLKVRRNLMAHGNCMAFTLMAYGHSSWRI